MLNLTNLIFSPTRVTDKSATLIDVILTSNVDLVKTNDVQRTLISDHYLVHYTLNLKLPKDKPVTITARSYKNFDANEFFEDVSKVSWDTVSLFEHIDDQVLCFNDLFLGVLDQHAPLRTFKVTHKKSKVITTDIKSLMQQRDDPHKLASQTCNPREWEAYRVLRRKVKSAIKASERQLIRNEISKSRDDKTSIWKTVRNCLNPGGRSILPYSRDCTEVANEFNQFFYICW